jgi:tyrosinase
MINFSQVNIAKGMDFIERGDIFARFTHLQHLPYTITISVNNNSGATRRGMVRIFMSPKYNERGNQYTFNDQRLLMIELDKFVANCKINNLGIFKKIF